MSVGLDFSDSGMHELCLSDGELRMALLALGRVSGEYARSAGTARDDDTRAHWLAMAERAESLAARITGAVS